MKPINKKIFLEKKEPAVAINELVDIINGLIIENNSQQEIITTLVKQYNLINRSLKRQSLVK